MFKYPHLEHRLVAFENARLEHDMKQMQYDGSTVRAEKEEEFQREVASLGSLCGRQVSAPHPASVRRCGKTKYDAEAGVHDIYYSLPDQKVSA